MSGEELNRLSRRRYLELLAELEHASGPPREPGGSKNRRQQQRIPFHHTILVALMLDGVEVGNAVAVRCRNLSSRGLGVFFRQQVSPGEVCQVMFVNADRQTYTVKSEIVRCRLLDESVFEVGMRFERALELGMLLPWLAGNTKQDRGGDAQRMAV